MNRNLLYMILRLIFVIVATVAGFYVLLYMSGLIYPFIIAFAFAYLINPVVNFLNQKLQFPRALAVLVSLILVFGAIVGLVTYLVTEAISATTYLLQLVTVKFPDIVTFAQQFALNHIMPLYDDLISKFNHLGEPQRYTITQNIQNLGTEATTQMKELLTAIISGLTNFISALPTTLTVLVFILLATFFISYDWHRLAQKARKLLPNRVHGYGKTIFVDLRKSFVWFCESTTYTRIYDNCHCTNRAFNITRTIRHYYRDYYRSCRFTTIFRNRRSLCSMGYIRIFHWRYRIRHWSSHFIHRRDCPKTNYGAESTFI